MLPCARNGARAAHLVDRTYRLTASFPSQKTTGLYVAAYHALRHASSSSQSGLAVRYNPAASVRGAVSPALNPPQSTRPPPLSLPTRQLEQSAPSYYFNLGKTYATFYKNGLKAVWTNGKAASALRRSKLQGITSLVDAARDGIITRGEWHLLLRSAADRRKIPLFALLFALCGEFTPLVVVFASPLVPWTCRIPKQVKIERKNRQERRRLSFYDTGEERLQRGGKEAGWTLQALRREELLHIGRCLALYGKTWDLLGGFPTWILRRRVEARFDYLQADDQLIKKGGGAAALGNEELAIACEERGLDVLDKDGKEKPAKTLELQLDHWLKEAEQTQMTKLLLLRPETFK